MKYFPIILALCILLCGCATTQETPDAQRTGPSIFADSVPEKETEPSTHPEPPTGENSDAPAPEEGPEGLPTPAL